MGSFCSSCWCCFLNPNYIPISMFAHVCVCAVAARHIVLCYSVVVFWRRDRECSSKPTFGYENSRESLWIRLYFCFRSPIDAVQIFVHAKAPKASAPKPINGTENAFDVKCSRLNLASGLIFGIIYSPLRLAQHAAFCWLKFLCEFPFNFIIQFSLNRAQRRWSFPIKVSLRISFSVHSMPSGRRRRRRLM